MKTLVEHINEALKIGKNLSDWTTYTYQPKTRGELKDIIRSRISKDGTNCDLNDIDTSLITNMSYLFYGSKFNGEISRWDVSKVNDMFAMFASSKFNQDISKWKINKNCDTSDIFKNCPIKEEYKPKLPR